jgi:hypothetical protein
MAFAAGTVQRSTPSGVDSVKATRVESGDHVEKRIRGDGGNPVTGRDSPVLTRTSVSDIA